MSDATSRLPPRPSQEFTESTGPVARTQRENTPLKMFSLLLSEPILNLILDQTRLFSTQNDFFDITKEELLAYFGINIAMGMFRHPRVHDYWSTKPMFRMPWFSAIVSRDKFFKINRYLHLSDSSKQKKKGDSGYDPLFKVRPLIDKTLELFPKYYQPKQDLAIDEMMVGTRCRIHFLQYIPKKPTKWGIKIFVNSESSTGYVLTYDVYVGASEKNHTHATVMKLMSRYLNKKHKLFTDNFYTSPLLFKDLLENGTYACGTIHTNRKFFPNELKSPSLKRPEYKFATCGLFTAGIWHDRRDVTFLSTIHSASVDVVQKRAKGSKEKEPIPCPSAIAEYNRSMNGVDITDQHLSYYSLTKRKTTKWWKKLFWRLIDICILNSCILFRANDPDSEIKTHRQFRILLVEQLTKPLLMARANPDSGVPSSHAGEDLTRLKGKHFVYSDTSKQRCVVCYSKKNANKRKDTKVSTFCPKCEEYMCIGVCFEKYHTQVDYKH